MNIGIRNTLITIDVLVVILVLSVQVYPLASLRLLLGIPLLLFAPGFALIAALFPGKKKRWTERIPLSIGLSLTVVPLMGLVLNYTAWGISQETTVYSVGSFILLSSLIAYIRPAVPASVQPEFEAAETTKPLQSRPASVIFSMLMVLAITGALVTIIYYVIAPKPGEIFTQFYIRGQEGKETIYPSDMQVGEKGTVILGITNHEGRETTYRVRVLINGSTSSDLNQVVLPDGQEWLSEVSFVPGSPGLGQKVEFLLYKGNDPTPYLEPLYLWIDVD